jgi:hypothetical protein
MSSPIQYVWESGAWHPLNYYKRQAEREFGEGEIRRLEVVEQRSQASHNNYFARLHDVWNNLPTPYQNRWPTPDDMRKWILTHTRFCTREEFTCASHGEAARWMRNLTNKFHRVEIEGRTVIGYTAHSQSRKAMSKRAFQESRDAVDQACAQILGVDVETLQREAGHAA